MLSVLLLVVREPKLGFATNSPGGVVGGGGKDTLASVYIDRLLENTSKYASRTVRKPLPGEVDREEEKKKLTALRAEEEGRIAKQEAEQAEAESRKHKLEELELQKKTLAEDTRKKQKELEEAAQRIRAVEAAEKQAKELREKNAAKEKKKIAVPEEKEEAFYTRKSKGIVDRVIGNTAEITKDAKEAKDAYQESCKILEMDQCRFVKASKELQGSMAKALERAVAYGEGKAVEKMYPPSARVSLSRASRRSRQKRCPNLQVKEGRRWKAEQSAEKKVRGGRQPPEEEEGLEWRERYYEEEWRTDRKIRSDEKYPPYKYEPFSKAWTNKLGRTLWDLARR